MKFFAFLIFWLLPKPSCNQRYQFWLSQGDTGYISFYWACKKMAAQWAKGRLMALDDEYRRQNAEVIKLGIASINRRYHGELPLLKPESRESGHKQNKKDGMRLLTDLPKGWTKLFAERFPNFANPNHRLQHVSYWQQRAAAMAGDTAVATPGEIFGCLHNQTAEELWPLFQQVSQALKKDGL